MNNEFIDLRCPERKYPIVSLFSLFKKEFQHFKTFKKRKNQKKKKNTKSRSSLLLMMSCLFSFQLILMVILLLLSSISCSIDAFFKLREMTDRQEWVNSRLVFQEPQPQFENVSFHSKVKF